MSKFNCGDRVVLFNAHTCEFESDFVFAVLYAPILKSGADPASGEGLKDKIASGDMVVKEQYQTCTHGVVDASVLFASEEDCKAFYADFFSR